MYLRTVHAEPDTSALHQFLRDNALGLLVTALPGSSFPTIQCTHIPWVLDVPELEHDDETTVPLGTLRGHIAKANPHAKAIVEGVTVSPSHSNGQLQEEVTIMCNGPAASYVTPKFYTATKPDTGKVVPTWNYSAVQVYGAATIYHDSRSTETGSFLQKQVEDLTVQAEERAMGYTGQDGKPKAWQVSDAPLNYVELLKKSITGIEIKITRLEGKWKMSQEMGVGDREGVINGFESLKSEQGEMIAQTVKARGDLKDRSTGVSAAA